MIFLDTIKTPPKNLSWVVSKSWNTKKIRHLLFCSRSTSKECITLARWWVAIHSIVWLFILCHFIHTLKYTYNQKIPKFEINSWSQWTHLNCWMTARLRLARQSRQKTWFDATNNNWNWDGFHSFKIILNSFWNSLFQHNLSIQNGAYCKYLS